MTVLGSSRETVYTRKSQRLAPQRRIRLALDGVVGPVRWVLARGSVGTLVEALPFRSAPLWEDAEG